MLCTIFRRTTPDKPCNAAATRYVPVAIGNNARMATPDDALVLGYVPLCPHHAEMIPAGVKLFSALEIGAVE